VRHSLVTALVAALPLAGLGAAAAHDRPGPAPALFHGGERGVTIGPTPRGVSDTTAAACGTCHAEIEREWRASLHSRAWDDPVFQAAYALEPMQFCRSCHAPTAAFGREPDRAAAAESVSCAVCHVRAGAVLSSHVATGAAPHPTFATRSLGESAFCAPCHQFNFPADPGRHRDAYATDEPMQDTFEEFRLSAAYARGETCQGCHMPWRDGPNGRRHRSHAFPGGSDVALLRQAVRVEVRARREGGDTVVEARLVPGDTGHSYPTGDLFRRAELSLWTDDDAAHPRTLAFAREFTPALERSPRGALVFVRRQSRDRRVPPPGTGPIPFQTLRFPGRAARVRWRLDHLLMPSPLAASHGIGEPRNRVPVLDGDAPVDPGGPP
jgi:hypothetical protein